MQIILTFKKHTHLGYTLKQLNRIFSTAKIVNNNKINEIIIGVQDWEENQKKFPPSLLKKIIRCRSSHLRAYEFLLGYRPFDNHFDWTKYNDGRVLGENK